VNDTRNDQSAAFVSPTADLRRVVTGRSQSSSMSLVTCIVRPLQLNVAAKACSTQVS